MTQSVPGPNTYSLPADEVIDALFSGIVRVRRRVEIYESDAETPFDIEYWDGRLVAGTVTVDRTRDERRMIDVVLENNDNALQLDPYSGFWYDKVLKSFWGIDYYDTAGDPQSYEVQIGEFMIDRITENRFPHEVKVTGRDYTKKCLTSKIKQSMVFPIGTPIETMITAIAANAGISKFALPVTGQAYELDIVFERGTERWNVIKKLADSIGYEVYFRGDGYLTMRPYPDPTFSPLSWIFRGGAVDGTLISYERSSNDSRIKNHIIVVGATTTENQLNTTVFAEASNTDPASPTRIDRLGDRVDIIENDYFTDLDSAQNFADKRLAISALEEFEINFESLIVPWLEGSDIVDIDVSGGSAYVPSRFLLSSFNFPLGLGPMSAQGRRVTIVGTNQTLEYQ